MKPISLLIFDLDGTLVDTLEDIAASVNYTLGRLNRSELPLDAVRRFVGDGIETLMKRSLGGAVEDLGAAVRIYKDHHRKNLVVRSALYPRVRETLEHFKAVPLAVVSNKTREFIDPLLAGLGIDRYFRFVIGADSGLPLKPAPESILQLLSETGARKERTAIAGDGTTDVGAGRAAGIITCAVTGGFRSEEELRAAGPDYLVRDLSEMKNLFFPDTGMNV